VLVVDNDRAPRTTVSSWIDPSAYRVVEAESADEALDAMDEAAADIAVCDLSMAGRDGVWLAWEVVRTHPQLGYDLLKRLPGLSAAAPIVLSPHEAFEVA